MNPTEPAPPGAHIHATDPFAAPESTRSPARKLRGRMVASVTLWTSPGPAGLTVSSTLVVDGDPGRVLGLIDPESELWPALTGAGRFAVTLLTPAQRALADRFAGLVPTPGGPFRYGSWHDTRFGPVPAGGQVWAGCHLEQTRPCGWGMLVEATIERIEWGPDDWAPLAYHRGRYRTVDVR